MLNNEELKLMEMTAEELCNGMKTSMLQYYRTTRRMTHPLSLMQTLLYQLAEEVNSAVVQQNGQAVTKSEPKEKEQDVKYWDILSESTETVQTEEHIAPVISLNEWRVKKQRK